MSNWRSYRHFSKACVLLVALSCATNLHAQSPTAEGNSSRPPRRPSLSPYLNLGIENTGALPSYQTFVVPRIDQQKQMMNQYMMQSRTAKIEALVDPGLRQTGLGGKYQNYSHFYPAPSTRARPR